MSSSLAGKFTHFLSFVVFYKILCGFGGMAPPVVGTTRCMSGGTDDDLG